MLKTLERTHLISGYRGCGRNSRLRRLLTKRTPDAQEMLCLCSSATPPKDRQSPVSCLAYDSAAAESSRRGICQLVIISANTSAWSRGDFTHLSTCGALPVFTHGRRAWGLRVTPVALIHANEKGWWTESELRLSLPALSAEGVVSLHPDL